METSSWLFGIFSLMVVGPVIYLIFVRNLIRAAFAFLLALLGMAALFVLLNAEYLAVVQLLIYAGGVIVLLIFGIMLTRRFNEEGVFSGHRGIFTGSLVFVSFLSLLAKGIYRSSNEWPPLGTEPVSQDQVGTIAVLFLTDHLLAFELIAFILLVALVGAMFLAKRSTDL